MRERLSRYCSTSVGSSLYRRISSACSVSSTPITSPRAVDTSCSSAVSSSTAEASRSHAYGHALIQWLIHYARDKDCDSFDLDSGVHRFRAHRFYFREGMHINAYHFTLDLRDT